MSKPTDVRVIGAELYFLPVQTLVPLKFGSETLTSVTCARVRIVVEDRQGKYPCVFLAESPKDTLPVWHLVGGLDPVSERSDSCEDPMQDQLPTPRFLGQWIEQDGLNSLKVKLRGNDAEWDYDRLVEVGNVASRFGDYFLSTDFNCMVNEPDYVNQILEKLRSNHPAIFDSILYVEQPFPYDLQANKIDVHSVADRKPSLMDESAHSWEYVRLGRSLGWSGVALKTCKTQTGALLSLCWAKAYKMQVMVQDLTNPMLAQIPHVLLAAHGETLRGVESNAMQFYPQASTAEAAIHPGLYKRRNGELDLTTISGSGFGYRVEEIDRELGQAVARAGDL